MILKSVIIKLIQVGLFEFLKQVFSLIIIVGESHFGTHLMKIECLEAAGGKHFEKTDQNY